MLSSTLAPIPFTLSLLTPVAALGAEAPAPATSSDAGKGAENAAGKPTEKLENVTVQGEAAPEKLSSPKYVKPLADTPQTITVVPQTVIQQQGATSLAAILKNSPGISLQAGEGGVPAGDNLSIRGFNARTDLFVDGVRDSGGYARDPFNVDQVEITKGPTSANAGRGSTGGTVNLVTKKPGKDTFYQGSITAGTADLRRMTIDVNQSLDGVEVGSEKDGLAGAAFRINAMAHESGAPGRDALVQNKRFGIAPAITFGLGSPTRFTLEYFHMDQENMPDYGLPWVPTTNAAANPGTLGGSAEKPAPVSRSNFYGLAARDYEKIRTDIAAATLVHEFSDEFSLRNHTQYGVTDRDSIVTPPRFATATGTDIRRTDVKSRDQVDTILDNQTDFTLKLDTGGVKHTVITGIEIARETSENLNRVEQNAAGVPTTDLWNPDPFQAYNSRMVRDGAKTELEATTLSAYLFDTIDFDEHWTWMGGARFDRYDVDYVNTSSTTTGNVRTGMGRTDDLVSWRTALTFKPTESGAIYAAYGTSFNPSTDALTQVPFTSAAQTTTAANTMNLDPEESRTIEIGTKWNFLKGNLLLSAAVFQTTKTNARTADPTDPTNVTLTGEQRVQGVELGATGHLTQEWSIMGGYCWMQSEVLQSSVPAEQGKELANTPEHSASLWTTYDFNFGLSLGAGATYVGSRWSSNANTREAPDYVTFDAMVAYRLNSHVTFRLNAYNLADENFIGSVGGGHFIPGAGRSFALGAEFAF